MIDGFLAHISSQFNRSAGRRDFAKLCFCRQGFEKEKGREIRERKKKNTREKTNLFLFF